LLKDHVIGLHRLHTAKPRARIEQHLRRADMTMHADPCAAPGDHQRLHAKTDQQGLQRGAINGVAQHQAFGAVAPRRVHVFVDVRRRHAGIVCGSGNHARAQRPRAALDVTGDAFQPVDKPLCPRIDDPCPLQQGHLLRRIRKRGAGTLQALHQAVSGVARQLARGFVEGIGKRRNHAEDGALHRLCQGGAGRIRAAPDRGGQRLGIQRRGIAGVLGHAIQELRHDRAGIAARAVDRVVADVYQQLADMPAAPAQRALQYAAQGGGKIAAGIAIGDREHVDAVQFLAGRDHPVRTRDHRPPQAGRSHRGGRGDGRVRLQRHGPQSAAARWRRPLRRSIAVVRGVSASTL